MIAKFEIVRFRIRLMKLPSLEKAVIPRPKLVDYLLSTTHRDGRHKAAFFNAFGFFAEDWQFLAAKLLRHASEHDVVKQEESPFGVRYVIEGIMLMADDREAFVRSVWFIETGEKVPRFVTAYPV